MDSVIKYVTNFFSGLLAIFTAVIPVSIVWYVLTGGAVFGIDVVANLTSLINCLGEGGFVGIVVFFSIIGVITPPSVSIPKVSGVTSKSKTSDLSPLRTAP